MTKTTKTPWSAPPRRDSHIKQETERYITGPNEMILAKMMYAYQDGNAELIVRAVNSHAALVEALGVLVMFADRRSQAGKVGITQGQFDVVLDRARAALTLAKGA